MIYDDYEAFVLQYREEYGDKTIVLFECGSFFEIYSDGSLVNMKDIADLLNIVVSRRNKAILEVSRTNFEMAGFPSHSLKKFLNIFLSNNYTVVLVTQTTQPPNPKRAVTEILSPGTCLDVITQDSSNLMVIYLDITQGYKSKESYSISCGCSIIDISTGRCSVYENSTYNKDKAFVYDEIYRLISTFSPRELEITSPEENKNNKNILSLALLKEYIDFGNIYIHDNINKLKPHYTNTVYQNSIISKAYKNKTMLNGIEFVDLERMPLATVSFTRLLQFAFNHNENILSRIKKPILLSTQNILLLSYTAAQQLDITNNHTGKKDNLMNILNNSKTAIGRRYFRYRFLHPYINSKYICECHDAIENITDNTCEDLRNKLGKIYDVERLFRKCICKCIQPQEFYNFFKSLEILKEIKYIKHQEYLDEILSNINETFDIDKLPCYCVDNLDAKVFLKENNIASIQDQYDKYLQEFNLIIEKLNVKDADFFRLEYNEKEGYYIASTQKRYNEVIKASLHTKIICQLKTYYYQEFTVKTLTNTVKISHDSFNEYNNIMFGLKSKINKLAEKYYQDFINSFVNNYENKISDIVSEIEYLDYITTNKYNANKYKLAKPKIVINSEESYANIQDLRHIIIEELQPDIKYISNDISIGQENKGILLYGINSAGKSSLMKSVGLAIIMAQAGMYAPCKNIELSPYHKIFCRTTSSDDIFKGQSTFTREILEIRNILSRTDKNSLVIGDEMASGTESISALSIVSAGIVTLYEKKSSYIFATHLHDLINIPEIKSICNLRICHLSVYYDESTKKLIFDRKLKDGNGNTLYGIEVCKSLDMDISFLNIANTVRHRLLSLEIESTKTSKYNPEVYITECTLCGSKINCEVHHIQEQRTAENNYIDTFHKNSKFNLAVLCEKCHDDVHANLVKINGYIQTSNGRELDIEMNTSSSNTVTKEELMEYFKDTSVKKKDIYAQLLEKYKLSRYKIKQIMSQ